MQHKEKILIVIAARSGSKGVKNKNVRKLGRLPLIAYSILQALKWEKTPYVICSTDSKEFAVIAKKYGALIPFMRAKELSGDRVLKIEVIRDALIRCEKHFNETFDIIVDLDATAPLRKISDLDNCLKLFKARMPNTLFSVVPARHNPYYNMIEVNKLGKAHLSKKVTSVVRARQIAPKVYDMNASIYFYKRDYLIDKKNLNVVTDNSITYCMDNVSAFDIDSELDFKFVKFLMQEGVYKREV